MAYEINININGDVAESTGISRTPSESENEISKYQKSLSKYVASQTIQPFIQEVKTTVSQEIGTMTGRTELQQRVNFGFTVAQQGVNAYKNAQAGAVITTGLGLGGGVGVALGLALSAIEAGMNVLFNEIEIQRKEMLEALDINKARRRTGVAYNRSRSS